MSLCWKQVLHNRMRMKFYFVKTLTRVFKKFLKIRFYQTYLYKKCVSPKEIRSILCFKEWWKKRVNQNIANLLTRRSKWQSSLNKKSDTKVISTSLIEGIAHKKLHMMIKKVLTSNQSLLLSPETAFGKVPWIVRFNLVNFLKKKERPHN